MMRTLGVGLLFVLGCTDHQTVTQEFVLTGDACKAHLDAESCDAASPCHWYVIDAPCQPGHACLGGVCSDSTGGGSGSGGGGSGGGGAACACPYGAACYEQLGSNQIECGEPYACPGGNFACDPCASITGQGTCVLSPDVANLCVCS